MHRELNRYMTIGEPVELIYIDSSNKITKRKVKLIEVSDHNLRAYCYTRRAPRTFMIDNILAVAPINTKRGRTA